MDIVTAKILVLVLTLVLVLVAGLVPLKIVERLNTSHSDNGLIQSRGSFIISLLNCFAGGVFFSTTLLHLLPECTEQFSEILHDNGIMSSYPVAELVIAIGFFVIMITEHFIMALQHHHHRPGVSDSCESGLSDQSESAAIALPPPPVERLTPSASPPHANDAAATATSSTANYGSMSCANKQQHANDVNTQHQVASPATHSCKKKLLVDIQHAEADSCVHLIEPSHHDKHHRRQLRGLRSLVLLLALSLHTVFEGMAIGLQQSVADVWVLFSAVLLHKLIMAFTLSIQFVSSLTSQRRVVVFMIVFAIMSPLGIAVGTGVSSIRANDTAIALTSAILQSLATGTFIYVTFFEVLHKEVGQNHSLMKVLAVIIGFSVVALLNLLE